MGALQEIFQFLLETLGSLYLCLVVLRTMLQASGADFYNPISQFVVKATQPPLGILRRAIPRGRRFDPALLVLAMVGAGHRAGRAASSRRIHPFGGTAHYLECRRSNRSCCEYLFNRHGDHDRRQLDSPRQPPSRGSPCLSNYRAGHGACSLPVAGQWAASISPRSWFFIVINVIQISLRHIAVATGLPTQLVIGI